jgi:hypothetical protein
MLEPEPASMAIMSERTAMAKKKKIKGERRKGGLHRKIIEGELDEDDSSAIK